ncbi:MAG: hypothetical protein ACPGXY_00495, partial [Alphaproteobacteria bacterium]
MKFTLYSFVAFAFIFIAGSFSGINDVHAADNPVLKMSKSFELANKKTVIKEKNGKTKTIINEKKADGTKVQTKIKDKNGKIKTKIKKLNPDGTRVKTKIKDKNDKIKTKVKER